MKKIAVLFFTRKAAEEVKYKRLLPSFNVDKNKLLIQKLIDQNISILEESKLDYFQSSDFLIKDGSFGSNITQSISFVFAKGYDSIIIIGNDTPGLSVEKLLQAKNLLLEGKTVIGPAQKGGIYLSAFHKKDFIANKFVALPFQSNKMRSGIESYFKNCAAEIVHIEQLNDLNSKIDFLNFLKKAEKTNFLKKIYIFLLYFRVNFQINLVKIFSLKISDFQRRGPPILH